MPAAARPGLKRWATNVCDKCCGPAPSQPPAQSFRHGAPPPGRATATRKVGETALSHPLFGWRWRGQVEELHAENSALVAVMEQVHNTCRKHLSPTASAPAGLLLASPVSPLRLRYAQLLPVPAARQRSQSIPGGVRSHACATGCEIDKIRCCRVL